MKEFNHRQRETGSIRKTFVSAGQNPWVECEKEFEEHLDRLAELPLYGGCKSTKELLEEKAIEFRTGLKLPGLEGLIEEEDVQETLEAAVEVAEVAEVKEVVDLSDE